MRIAANTHTTENETRPMPARAGTRDTPAPPAPSTTRSATMVSVPPETDEQRQRRLDEISSDPGLRGFYERAIPRGIAPAAWIPFWPSAWSDPEGLERP